MKVKILKHFVNESREYGEYYVEHDGSTCLVIQNESDYKAMAHLRGHCIKDCLLNIRQEVIDAIKQEIENSK